MRRNLCVWGGGGGETTEIKNVSTTKSIKPRHFMQIRKLKSTVRLVIFFRTMLFQKWFQEPSESDYVAHEAMSIPFMSEHAVQHQPPAYRPTPQKHQSQVGGIAFRQAIQ